MIELSIDQRALTAQIVHMTSLFGDANQTGVARWGVATARRLAVETQAFGSGQEARISQEKAIFKDAHKNIMIVRGDLARRVMKKKLPFFMHGGQRIMIQPYQNVTTAAGVNLFLDASRGGRKQHVIEKPATSWIVTTDAVFKSAMKARIKRAGKAKGGWIGAGKQIGEAFPRSKRITIGKNFLSYAHKHSNLGSATATASTWEPVGILNNHARHAGNSNVIKSGAMQSAVHDGGVMMIREYERRLQGRLNRR
jgi:hypothetical protein